GPWKKLRKSAAKLLAQSMPRGIAPDWVTWKRGRVEPEGDGSYDAIRVYLWLGMWRPSLARAAAKLVRLKGFVPEHVDPRTLETVGRGPPGFAAAFLPLVPELRVDDSAAYYDQALSLFGKGFAEKRFSFDAEGRLSTPCRP